MGNEYEPLQQKKAETKQKVGLLGCISLIVGTMIGSGIFASTSNVFINAGSPGMALIVWTASGVLVALISLCYVEMGTMIPLSGGEYSYYSEAFGELPAFVFSYTSTLFLKPAQLAAILLACGDYITVPFFYNDCNVEDRIIISKILASFILGVVIFINCVSVRWATNIQVVFTAAKLITITILVITGLVRLAQGFDNEFKNAFTGPSLKISSIGYAFYGGLWAYDGWNTLNLATEEIKSPNRDLPLAIIIGIPLVTGCYVLINVAYLTVLTSSEIASSNALAVTMANRVYGKYAFLIPIFVAFSTVGAANGTAFSGGRLAYAAARKNHLPKVLAMLHCEKQTPIPALVVTCILAWIMMIPDSSNFTTVMNYCNFVAWMIYSFTIVALLWLRFKRPNVKRPFKIFIGIPIFVLFFSVYLVIAPFYENPLGSTYCLLVLSTGILVYFLFIKYRIVPQFIMEFFDKFTLMVQMLANLYFPNTIVESYTQSNYETIIEDTKI
ncbi:b(0,+)-type amino acid transporter 1-like isoform X1 [Hydra vulgaris]|uniref:B(0,+)-type amino acid transporter 1-like isoform X1 n=2 Tax=Hydra vulgaris TaxID=6087 RepID=A0ABM4DQ61_HYDVU